MADSDGEGRASRRSVVLATVGLAVLAIAVRLPLFGVPLDSDEGGYAFVAHRWAQGGHLYRNPWIDRPQGLMLVFRAITDVSYSVTAVRIGALLTGLVLTLAVAAAAWAVAGRGAALVAGTIAAVVGSGSFLEGYEMNGELVGSAVGTCGVALALWWSRKRLGGRWLFVAGLACGAAPLVKQSMGDATVALLCIVVATRRFAALPAAIGGLVTLPLLAVLWAWRTGWHEWWYAVVRFQLQQSNAVGAHDRWTAIHHSLRLVAYDLAGLACAAVLALLFTWRRPGQWALLAWLVAALAGASAGASLHPHYWVQVVAPLAVLAGTVMVSRPRHTMALQVAVAVLALAIPVARLSVLTVSTPSERAARVVPRTDPQRFVQQDVARWLDANTAPSDSVYAFVAAADLYLRSDRTTSFPYLWWIPLHHVPGALPQLQQWLSGGDAPRWIVVYNAPEGVDGHGPLAGILTERYAQTAVVDGHPILRLKP